MPVIRVAAFAAAAVFAFGAYAVLSYPAHHDSAWLLYVAGRVLDGAVLYRDVVEVNPPLIIWLTLVPELIARALGAWPTTIYRLFVLALAGSSLLLAERLLRAWYGHSSAARGAILVLLAWALVAAPGFEFGQREHIAIVLVLPYLLLTAQRGATTRVEARARAIPIGVMAGIGFALKPHFVLAWLLPELWLLRRRGPRALLRAELYALLATFALYALALLLYAPDYIDIARLAATTYTGYAATSPLALLRHPSALIILAAGGAWLLARRWFEPRAHGDVLALALAGFFAGVLVQRKGWTYHWIPALTLAWLMAGLLVVRLRSRLKVPGDVAFTLLAALLALGLTTRDLAEADAQREAMKAKAFRLPELMEVVARYGRGGPIVALSTNMQAGFPLVNYTDAGWGLRFNSLWLLPGVYDPKPPQGRFPYRAPSEMPPAEKYLYQAVIEDLARSRPTVLIVDRLAPGYILHGFDYLEYFGRDPRFAALLRDYREARPVERYRVLVRVR